MSSKDRHKIDIDGVNRSRACNCCRSRPQRNTTAQHDAMRVRMIHHIIHHGPSHDVFVSERRRRVTAS